jgi:ribonucleoside-diphosphate reductase alpha chain
MFTTKRNNQAELIDSSKIHNRIQVLCYGLQKVDVMELVEKVTGGLSPYITTTEIDHLIAETCASMCSHHHEYETLAGRLVASSIQKDAPSTFLESMMQLHSVGLLNERTAAFIRENISQLCEALRVCNDFSYGYFSMVTLRKSYLLHVNGSCIETPQYMLMRVSCGMWNDDISRAVNTYNMMSEKQFIHASPTLFNCGTSNQGLSSCFLLPVKEDSVDGIFDSLKQCAKISQGAGGIGLSVSNIRSKGSKIGSCGGISDGLVPLLRIFNDTARYINQSGKRKGAFAVYLEPWHADIREFLDLGKPHGVEELRARDLFFSLWICDIFMERVRTDGTWSLMCPRKCIGLTECWGDEFNDLYLQYENQGKFVSQIPARELWRLIVHTQQETGMPYMLYKDSCNRKSNQRHLGTIKSSNLCAEVVEYSSDKEVAVCNLGSVSLPACVCKKNGNRYFDFTVLRTIAYTLTENLNRVIDTTSYPVEESNNSNKRHRPIGVGVQGLADVFMLLSMAYDSEDALKLNRQIFEVIYFSCLRASCDLARVDGSHESFTGSPLSQGIYQFDLWECSEDTSLCDWPKLRSDIKLFGVRNSLVSAAMPTASTAQIMGNTESFEPLSSNIYTRRTLAGEFICINKLLVDDLEKLDLWNDTTRTQIISDDGSVKNVKGLPDNIKDIYRTVWEIPMKSMIDMSADRGPFIDQSQSLNCYLSEPTVSKITSMHFYAFDKGLKTGMYYLRMKAPMQSTKFTIGVDTCTSCNA